jgi:hypothetical protein
MTDHADPVKLDTSAEPYVLDSRPIGAELSSEAEAAFYAMVAIVNRIELRGVNNPTKAVAALDARNAEVAKQVTAQNEEFEKLGLNEKAPHPRIRASLLLAGFLGGALLGYALLTQGIGLEIIADGPLAGHQMQSAPLRAAEDVPSRHESGSGHRTKFLVQIGSYKSQTEALAAWSAFARDHPDVGAHQPDIKTVDLGGMGVWHRLRLSNFADRKAASEFCEQLKSDGAACLTGR